MTGTGERDSFAIDVAAAYTPSERISPARIVIEGSRIAEIGTPSQVGIATDMPRVEAGDLIATPGFIDAHIHGSSGVDVMEATWDAFNTMSGALASHGTTSFLPTTVSASTEVLGESIRRFAGLQEGFVGANPIGIHLEGPFISPIRRGTHPGEHIRDADAALLEEWIDMSEGAIRLLTIAPEVEGIDAVIKVAQDRGVTVAMGHSDATMETAREAADLGVCYAVHTFNAMRGLHHRDPGIAGAVLSDDRVRAEIIADGVHVDPAFVRVFARSKGRGRVLLVTDGTSATDMPDGEYSLGASTVSVSEGVSRDSEGRLAGSTLTQDVALRNYVEWTGADLAAGLEALTTNPAAALGIEDKGRLRAGSDADIVLLDRTLAVMRTYVGGRAVFDKLHGG